MPERTSATNEDVAAADAEAAGLRHVTDAMPGILRTRHGQGFRYRKPDGTAVRDQLTLDRIKALVIPPAWTDVWICSSPNGHLQVTGRDQRGRKQYKYHPRWRVIRDENKYARLADFGHALPQIRDRVQSDLRRHGLPREKVLAVVLRLLETTLIRVGNDEYAQQNASYGLTTMNSHHVRINGQELRFRFDGKSGKQQDVSLSDAQLARLLGRIRELPGQQLFQFIDDDGNVQDVDSTAVNEYLRGITGEDFTAKDFRTWAGTLVAMCVLIDCLPDREIDLEAAELAAIDCAAERLGNTRAVCRSAYIHPALFNAWRKGDLERLSKRRFKGTSGLDKDETLLLHLLELV